MTADRTERPARSPASRGVLMVVVWREGTGPRTFRARLRWTTDLPSAEGTVVVRSVKDALTAVHEFLRGWSEPPKRDNLDSDTSVTPSSRNRRNPSRRQ